MKAMPLALTAAGLMLFGLGGIYIGGPDGGFYSLRSFAAIILGAAFTGVGLWLARRRR